MYVKHVGMIATYLQLKVCCIVQNVTHLLVIWEINVTTVATHNTTRKLIMTILEFMFTKRVAKALVEDWNNGEGLTVVSIALIYLNGAMYLTKSLVSLLMHLVA